MVYSFENLSSEDRKDDQETFMEKYDLRCMDKKRHDWKNEMRSSQRRNKTHKDDVEQIL